MMNQVRARVRSVAGVLRKSVGHVLPLFVVALLLFVAMDADVARGAPRSVEVRWTPSPSIGVVRYRLSLGDASGRYTTHVDVSSAPQRNGVRYTSIQIDDARPTFMALRAYSVLGVWSAYSNEVVVPAFAAASVAALSIDANGDLLAIDEHGAASVIGAEPEAAAYGANAARCDIDGDGERDLILGFGAGGPPEVAVHIMQDGTPVQRIALDPRAADPARLAHLAGMEAFPACGDPDGDGRNEIVVGFGPWSGGVLVLFDDVTTGFEAGRPIRPTGQQWAQDWQFVQYRQCNGLLRPALGDIDGDGLDEIALGSADTWVVLLDDALSGFGVLGALGARPENNSAWYLSCYRNGVDLPNTRVALGDLDADGLDEIAIGLVAPDRARVFYFDDALTGYRSMLSVQQPGAMPVPGWGGALAHSGFVVSSISDLDGVAPAELVLSPFGHPDVALLARIEAGLVAAADDLGQSGGWLLPGLGLPILALPSR